MASDPPAPQPIADTAVLSAELEAQLLAGSAGAPRSLLLIEAGDHVDVVPMRSGTVVVIGREAPADVVIADRSLSRQHARFEQVGDELFVQDLGSTNGTCLAKERIEERCALRPGDVVTLGTVVVAVQGSRRAPPQPPSAFTHDAFLVALGEEVTRARFFGRTVVMALVDAGTPAQAIKLRAALPRALRPVDRVALFGGATLELLLPELDDRAAEARLRESLGAAFDELRVGFASYPSAASGADELMAACTRALAGAGTQPSFAPPVGQPAAAPTPSGASAVVVSPALRAVYGLVGRLASSQIPVLIQGETGAGKEVLARAIVAASPRRDRPLIAINCGAIPSQLVESTLFGHEKGAFTGAHQQHKGVFEAADGGTVFLDEVGELPLSAQSALLRVLSDRRVTRVGATREIPVDVRLICATHRDLETMVAQETFRMDLLYRLNAMTLSLPPLRDRPEEIRPLAQRFIEEANRDHGRAVRSISEPAVAALEAYDFPGNVRELRNIVERAVVIAEGSTVTIGDLPDRVQLTAGEPTLPRGNDFPFPSSSPRGSSSSEGDLKTQLAEVEADIILRALDDAGGNQSEAARRLRIPRRTLVHKIATLGIKKRGYGREA